MSIVMEQRFLMQHRDGTQVTLHLPAPAGTAGKTMTALAKLGFELVRTDNGLTAADPEPPRALLNSAGGEIENPEWFAWENRRREREAYASVDRATTSDQRGG